MEKVGALPDRLRLLKLPGAPRARAFLQTCADLLKEDAGGAASVLGSVESTIPGEAKWATRVTETLNNNGEEDISAARGLLRRLGELAELFASVEALLHTPAAGTITEVLASESFNERIADLRQATRVLGDATRALYGAERARVMSALAEITGRIQARPGWVKITAEDREELARELTAATLPEHPQDPIGSLQRALLRRLELAELEDRLVRAIDARVVARAAPEAGQEFFIPVAGRAAPPDDASEKPAEAVSLADLLPQAPLASAADVERWITDLRARLLERVQQGPIRLTVGR